MKLYINKVLVAEWRLVDNMPKIAIEAGVTCEQVTEVINTSKQLIVKQTETETIILTLSDQRLA